jgi:zinc transport system ATP-binding protein
MPGYDGRRHMPLSSALEVSGLSVRFGAVAVLHDLTFEVPQRSIVAVIGPNGSGKTVLFRALIGAIPHAGSVRWPPGTRIGYVPQKLDIERDVPITGADFLVARSALGGLARGAIDPLVASVGLTPELCTRPIGALSGGQFQRLLVAFALIGDPTVLLLDEPTANVDEPGQERLNELVYRLHRERGLTVLLISHELALVSRYATAVLCLGRGRAHFGPPQEILTTEVLEEVYGAPMRAHYRRDGSGLDGH